MDRLHAMWRRLHALRLFDLILLYVLFDVATALVRTAVHYAFRFDWFL